MIIILIIVLIGFFFLVAMLLAGGVIASQSWAKKKAKKWVEAGHIDESYNRLMHFSKASEIDKVSRILSHTTNDLEAQDLWRKLQDLKEKGGKAT